MSGGLAGRVALVTGAGRGIGSAVGEGLAREGAHVVLAARTVEDIEQVAGRVRGAGGQASAFRCDVADEASVHEMVKRVHEVAGPVDILINNAGHSSSAPLGKITLDEWNRTLAVNATGAFLCARELVPGMVQRKWGRIVNIASIAGLEGARYVAHYSAAKHALVGFTRSIALELAGTGVTVNALCPGYVDTPMTERTLANVQSRAGLSREEATRAVLASVGQERLVKPEEVAERVLALCGREADGVTGQALVIPGQARMAKRLDVINPESLGEPRGWNNGLLAPTGGRTLFVAGQTGVDGDGEGAGVGRDFTVQFGRALDKILAVVRAAGGEPRDVARLTAYVTDLGRYRASLKALGGVWRERFGKYYPAMALVEVKGLVEPGALVEIEASAVIGGSR